MLDSQAASHLYLIISLLPSSSSSNSFFFCIFCIPIHLFSFILNQVISTNLYLPQPSDMMAAQPSITTTPKSWSQMVSREQQQTNQSVLETGSEPPLSSCGSTLPLVSRLEDIMSEELAQELTFDLSKSQTQSQSQSVPGTSSGGDGAATATSENLAVFLAEAGLSTTDLKELSESRFVLF